MGQDERHYNIKKLNFLFAISSLVLLGAISLLFAKDYFRGWKDYQGEFRSLEVEKARVKYDKASLSLQEDPEYQAILDDYNNAQKDFDANCSSFGSLDDEIEALRAENAIITQRYKFSKAELDAAKYRYEHAEAHHENGLDTKKEAFHKLNNETNELKLATEDSNKRLADKEKIITSCSDQLKKVEKKKRQLASKADLLERKLKTIDPQKMGFTNQIANIVRDLPVLDLANPNNKIEQVVLKDLQDNVNFMNVPKVERCITCHQGITNPDYKDAAQPFKTHPNLDLYVGKNSPHPLEEFGCTTCHGGRGRGTSFISAAHTPRDEKQKKEWEEKYGWHKIELWEDPMHPAQFVEAGCYQCHSGESHIKGADKLNLGLHIIEKAGCYNCHEIEKYKEWPKSGPTLEKLSSKLSKEWAYKWINDPASFRHNTWMPTYWRQSNNDDPESLKRGEQEVHAIVHYLFDQSEDYSLDKYKFKGNAQKGEELVASVGCFACHQYQPAETDDVTTQDILRKQHGPNLIGLASKTSKEWLFDWLKNPAKYHPNTRMPDLRLTDQEAADIVEFLSQNSVTKFDQQAVPAIDEKIVDDITFGFLKKMQPTAQAKAKLAGMSLDDKLSFTGQKLIGQYGCFSCHDIKGFDGTKPIGAELTEVGDKSTHKLDFGFIHIDHTNYAWFKQKLKDPRSFDKGKVKAPDEKLMMPNFYLSDEEIEAVTTALMGFVDHSPVASKIKPRTPENLFIEEGQKIVKQLNCQGCHMVEHEGGSIQDTVTQWLVEYGGHPQSDADKFTESYSPPNLLGIGEKVNPEWLFAFLHQPSEQIRPWMKVRMPTFTFNTAHLNTLVTYFNTLDEAEFPFQDEVDVSLTPSEYKIAEKLFSNEYFDCQKCHVVSGQMPTGSPETWAPDLSRAKSKLRAEWVIEWIKNPTAIMPGTKMPTFFDPDDYENSGPPDVLDGDEDEQIRVLRNFLMSLSEQNPQKPKKKKAPETKTETPPPVEETPPADKDVQTTP